MFTSLKFPDFFLGLPLPWLVFLQFKGSRLLLCIQKFCGKVQVPFILVQIGEGNREKSEVTFSSRRCVIVKPEMLYLTR